jgi:hypothetical protein
MSSIGRDNPTCFLFLIDQSKSMRDPSGVQSDRTKAQGVADAINELIQTLITNCTIGTEVADRFYIGMIGYGTEVGLGFPGVLADNILQPISRIAACPLHEETRIMRVQTPKGWTERPRRMQVWVEPAATGWTAMCRALEAAREVIAGFVEEYPRSFPPIVINITDGKATDGDPRPFAAALRSLATSEGNVLLLNLHISEVAAAPIFLPSSHAGLPDAFACQLFEMSSPLPPAMQAEAIEMGWRLEEGARGFAFNADMAAVVSFLNIGTQTNRSGG